jgi:hypothetical protein
LALNVIPIAGSLAHIGMLATALIKEGKVEDMAHAVKVKNA